MKLVELMEKNDQKKIQLLYFLDQHPNQKVKNNVIQDKLRISYYLFKNLTKEIAEDIDAFQLADFFNIEITETHTILYEHHNTNASVFLAHYLKRSYQVKILIAVMIEFKSFNLNDFAEAHYVSYAFMYKRFAMLRKTLMGWEIVLNKNAELTGDELAIRLLLSEIVIITHLGGAHFNEDVRTAVDQLLNLADTPEIVLSMSQLIETKSYFLVSLLRFQQGYSIKTSQEIADLIRNIGQKTVGARVNAIRVFEAHFRDNEREINSECDYLVTFLAIMGIITSEDIVFPETIKSKGRAFIQGFEENFHLTLEESEKDNIEYEVNKCFVDILTLPFRSQFFDEHIEVSFFFRTYPEFFEYCQKFVLYETTLKSDSNKAKFMFYHCLLTLAANVPLNKILAPLNVCVDFTLGKEYNKIIERDIKYFSTLNVEVTNTVLPETKLIITDLVNAYSECDISKVIWLSPPRPEDWENLIDELLDLRLEGAVQND
ncbi:helix-turn-helix domain-containing protein [Enterococcus hirae]|nr:helix-turn-helix domain-containing protein [Enterococcus hirae]